MLEKTEQSGRLLTPGETADRLRVSVSVLSYWRHLNRGPRWIRIGKHCRYIQKDLDAYVAGAESGGGR